MKMSLDGEEVENIDLEKRITCPKGDVLMKQIIINKQSQNIIIDHCDKCDGYWFDREELNKVIDKDTFEKELPFLDCDINEADFKCPRCQGDMNTMMLYDIKVDLCLGCGGIWLDEGELHDVQRERRFEKNQNKLMDLLQDVLDS